MAPRKTASSSPIPIGNCEVTVEATDFSCRSEPDSLQISLSTTSKITISLRKEVERNSISNLKVGLGIGTAGWPSEGVDMMVDGGAGLEPST
ncbi:hypothetical protein RchiOBHm_Chr3g0484101 [Rosa chinensis]|uniref:Uncharacterized protein n=1 Tax=Rosa chinensis TaxID=74649 RepID=A0A2P6REM8_ROSCH|nr:hypothetical protein RchiOBHm_Chr3g0484101 [Rosa chinensis]